jgi:predicted metal-dependent HD superfamily phosphohydrolase
MHVVLCVGVCIFVCVCLLDWARVQVRQLYMGAGRFYHTLQHIDELFGKLERFKSLCDSQLLVSAAIFFHDVIYDATRQDNEELSAQLWEMFAAEASSLAPADIAKARA